MVQILEANPTKRPSFLDSLFGGMAPAVKPAVDKFLEAKQGQEKQNQFSQALQGLQETYANPELSQQEKLIQAYQQMAGNPELAGQLGGQLSRLGGQQESFQNKIMQQQQEKAQMAQSLQNIQGLYANPDLSEEEKTFAIYQELSQNPTLAHNLIGSLQKPAKVESENIASEQFSRGHNALLEGDMRTYRKIVSDPKTPLSVKRQLTELQNKLSTRKDVEARESRIRRNVVEKSYKGAIENERKKLSDSYTSRKDAAEIKKNIKRLEVLQEHDMKRLAKDPNVYNTLSLWNHVDPDFLPSDEDIEAEYNPKAEQKEKIRFDSKNPDHVAYARQVLEQAGGDRAKANAILAEEFSK